VHVHDVRLLGLDDDSEAARFGVAQRLTVNARAAGPRLGKEVQTAIRASKSGAWSVADDGTVVSGGIPLVEGEYVLETVVSGAQDDGNQAVGVLPREGFVVLDTDVTPELRAVGIVRDVIRVVQQARREAGLHVSDRIRLTVAGDGPVWDALVAHQETLTTETMAVQAGLSGDLADLPAGDAVTEATVGQGHTVRVKVERTSAG
jgi:isoleucyl-tRNA synthetase